jgi:hypothetical protein
MQVRTKFLRLSPATAVQVQNGTFATLPVPPARSGNDSGLGVSVETTADSGANYTTIPSGPNQGFTYFATNLTYQNLYQYIINPDLANSNSIFAAKQYGMCGYISYSNLLTQTTRHEAGSVQSHYVNYGNGISSYNPGVYFEARIANPGADLGQFGTDTRNGLNNLYGQITAASLVEPYPVNYSETGTPLGNINYAPYASCP